MIRDKQEILEERKRLTDLQEKLQVMIKQHKEAQGSLRQKDGSRPKKRRDMGHRTVGPEKVITQDTMAIGSGTEEELTINAIKEKRKQKRRSSSIKKTLTPKAERMRGGQQKKIEQECENTQSSSSEEPEKGEKFVMPSASQVKYIAKLHVCRIEMKNDLF